MKKKWFIGIDISKKTLDVVISDPTKKHADETNYKQVLNAQAGYESLFSWMKEKGIRSKQSVICLENTGIYGYDLCLFLESCNQDYCSFNPLDLKRSLGLVRGKNDRVDAGRIARYGYLHRDELVYSKLSGTTILLLRDLSSERKRLVKHLAENKGFITDRKGREPTSTSRRAEDMVRILEEQIQSVEDEMRRIISSDSAISLNYQLLNSIKGIGDINAINIIVHTNNFKGFETARQYACYLGIAPFGYSSGTSVRGKTRVCATGAKLLKADISQAARSAVVWDKELKEYYERKTKEGKEHGVVLNAVKFKLVCRMFAVVRRGTPFVDLITYKN